MRIIECPVCGRQYRFDESKMTKDKIRVKCRKCENVFTISKDMFTPNVPDMADAIGTEQSSEETTPAPQGAHAVSLVIKAMPNEATRLRVAIKLVSLTGEKLSTLNRRLAKTPAVFHLQMATTKADSLLRAIEATGAKAELVPGGASEKNGVPRRKSKRRGRWKSWAIAAVVLLMVAGGSLSYHVYKEVQRTHILEQRGIDSVIPAGGYLYLRLRDLKGNWQRVRKYPIHRGLSSLVHTVCSFPQYQDISHMKKKWEKSIPFSLCRLKTMDLIGSDTRVALYVGDTAGPPQFVLTLKGNARIKLLETVGRWLGHWHGSSPIRKIDPEGRLYVFHPRGMKREIYFFSEGLVYVFSTSPDLIKRSLSLVRGDLPPGNSVRSIPLLRQKSEGRAINQLALFYLGLRNLAVSKPTGGQTDRGPFSLTSLACCGDVVGTISYGRGLVLESTMTFHSESLNQHLRGLLLARPRPNKVLRYITNDSILYVTNNNVDLPAYLSWLRENPPKQNNSPIDVDGILSEIKAKAGVDIESDMVPFLGRGVSYAITDMNPGEMGDFPAAHLFIEVTNREKVDGSIRQLLKKLVIPSLFTRSDVDVVTTNYKGIPITQFRCRRDPGVGTTSLFAFTPAYAFVEQFLVIATSAESLKRTVDLAMGPGTSLIRDRRFSDVRHLIGNESSGIAYADLRALSRLVKGLLTETPLGAFFKSGGKKAQDLLVALQVLETLNCVWAETDAENDRVRILMYLAL